MDKIEGQVTRPSLGRLGFIGELYDVRSESFSSRSLLKTDSSLIQRRDLSQMEFNYKYIKNMSDRCELINVEAELQLSILLNLIRVEGSGKFLMQEKKSEKSVLYTLACKILTTTEKFFTPFDELVKYIDMTALDDCQYTHVITEVNWGANCLLSLEASFNSDSEKIDVKGNLESELNKIKQLVSIDGKGKLVKEDFKSESRDKIKIEIFSDIVPEDNWPTSTTGFCNFVSDLPKLLKKVNDGKGKPLNYVMIPLNTIRKIAKLDSTISTIVKNFDKSFLLSVIYFFQRINQIKEKFYDLITILIENKKYVQEGEIEKVKLEKENLCIKETELKLLIGDNWVDVKSGKVLLKDLIKKTEDFKNTELKLSSYESFLDSYSSLLNKLFEVKNYTSKGVIYLGIGEKLDTLISTHLFFEFIVLVTSSDMEKTNPDLHIATCYYFLSQAALNKSETKYVVVDLDYVTHGQFSEGESTETKCYLLKGTQILNSDLYAEYLMELGKNYCQLRTGSTMIYSKHKPGSRVILEMICPGFETGVCPSDSLNWVCRRCKSDVEYGFDDYFYCGCGKGPVSLFEYRCKNANHGDLYLSPTLEFLKNVLSKLRPINQMNVLVIGQSGVGKSTWINSIINYLTYDSLESAKKYGPLCVIPASFTVYDSKTFKQHVIRIGEDIAEEVTEAGLSATQFSQTYNIFWENTSIRIIDTPGIGDTRGIGQDKLNMRNIIDHIGHLKELHAVCILLKANDNRINTAFSYCLKELLTHLHKNAAKNIVFCFTNARNSFYSPGQTSVILEKLLSTINDTNDLALGYHNMFCLDNEAFLFLCSLNNPEIHHDELLVKSFSQSWEISLKETLRLFNIIKTFEPHSLTDTLSLVTARNRILLLSKPIAECSKTIQLNLSVLQRKKEEINSSELIIAELSKKLEHTEIYLDLQPLSYPMTVCTNGSCIDYITYKDLDVRDIEYKQHCHVQCYIKTLAKTTNNAKLRGCAAMGNNGICNKCGCPWESHMHLTYKQIRKERKVIDKNVEKFIKQEMSAQETIEKFMEKLQADVEKFKKEQELLISTSVKFGMFLKSYSITCYNNSVEEYLEYLITEEEQKPHQSKTERKLLEYLKETLAHHKAESQILQEVLKTEGNDVEVLTTKDVFEMEQKLYDLKLMGETIKKSVEVNNQANTSIQHYSEKNVKICPKKENRGSLPWKVLKKFSNFFY